MHFICFELIANAKQRKYLVEYRFKRVCMLLMNFHPNLSQFLFQTGRGGGLQMGRGGGAAGAGKVLPSLEGGMGGVGGGGVVRKMFRNRNFPICDKILPRVKYR